MKSEKKKTFQKELIKPGIYPDMTNEEYHGDDAIGSTAIKDFYTECPLYFYEMYIGPNKDKFRSEVKKSKSCDVGTNAHFLLLEPEKFEKFYTIAPDTYLNEKGEIKPMNKLSNFWKTLKKVTENASRKLITNKELELARNMANSILSNPEVKPLFSQGITECSFFAKDPITGLILKARPDVLQKLHEDFSFVDSETGFSFKASAAAIIDYKSTKISLTPRDQNRNARNSMRHLQGSFHKFVTELALTEARMAITIIQHILYVHGSQTPPYLIDDPWRLPDVAIEGGDIIRKIVLMQIKKCFDDNHWPNYSEWGHMLSGENEPYKSVKDYEYLDYNFNEWELLEERFLKQ